jgi:DNA-directed RNA polymerase subunit K/omega
MINRSPLANSFEFVILAALRTAQLQKGCVQRVMGAHKLTTLAQMEIVAGKVGRLLPVSVPAVIPPE